MEVALDPDWLVDRGVLTTEMIEGKRIEELPYMKLSLKGVVAMRSRELWILGGHHWHIALMKHINNMKVEVKVQKKAIKDTVGSKTIAIFGYFAFVKPAMGLNIQFGRGC